MKVISRQEAFLLNQKWFFDGETCRNGHIDKRYVNTGICYGCKREQNKRWIQTKSAAVRAVRNRTYRKNIEKHKERSRSWANKNIEKSRSIKRKNKLKYLDKYRKMENLRCREKRKNNILYKISRNISKEIWAALHGKKQGRTFKSFLSYEITSIKNHLESKFSKEMNWENYGSYWEIDHIVPISHFYEKYTIEDAVKRAWDINNLQPLEKRLNRSKQHRNTYTREEFLNELHKRSS